MIALQRCNSAVGLPLISFLSSNFLPSFTYDCPIISKFSFAVQCLVGAPLLARGAGFRLLFDSMGDFVFPR